MLIIAGSIHVDEQDREDYVQGCAAIVEQARSAEGCWDFALSADVQDPRRVNIFERWESEEHLEKFRGEGVFPEQAARIRTVRVQKYRVSGVEEP